MRKYPSFRDRHICWYPCKLSKESVYFCSSTYLLILLARTINKPSHNNALLSLPATDPRRKRSYNPQSWKDIEQSWKAVPLLKLIVNKIYTVNKNIDVCDVSPFFIPIYTYFIGLKKNEVGKKRFPNSHLSSSNPMKWKQVLPGYTSRCFMVI